MPNMKFEDVIEKIENLGHKREVKVIFTYKELKFSNSVF